MNEKQKGSIINAYFAHQFEPNMLFHEGYEESLKEVTAKVEDSAENYTFLNNNIKESGNVKKEA